MIFVLQHKLLGDISCFIQTFLSINNLISRNACCFRCPWIMLFAVCLFHLITPSKIKILRSAKNISKKWMGRDVEGSGHSLIWANTPALEMSNENPKNFSSITSHRTDIWIRDLSNTKHNCYVLYTKHNCYVLYTKHNCYVLYKKIRLLCTLCKT
jgi:hypothetical protein